MKNVRKTAAKRAAVFCAAKKMGWKMRAVTGFPTLTHMGKIRESSPPRRGREYGKRVVDWWDFPPLEVADREMTKLSNKCLKIAKIVETTNL